jgi:hypothetical protein
MRSDKTLLVAFAVTIHGEKKKAFFVLQEFYRELQAQSHKQP